MDNFLIIDDVDTNFVEQNSWIILLEKQIARNLYLLKLYEKDKLGKKCKINCKELKTKIKSSIHDSIRAKRKNRKDSQKNTHQHQSQTVSLSLRRKTQELPKKAILKILQRKNSSSPHALPNMESQHIFEQRQSRYAKKQISNDSNFLPQGNQSMVMDRSQSLTKNSYKMEIFKKFKLPKFLPQTKPILSLHQLELNTRQFFPPEQTYFHKRQTNIQKLLTRSSMKSPKKQLPLPKGFSVKKTGEELPDIGRLNCKNIFMSEFSTQYNYHFESVTVDIKEKSPKSVQKTQQTKESDCQNLHGLESILQYYDKFCNKNQYQGMEGCHQNKSSLIKNYRISKIKNFKFPIH